MDLTPPLTRSPASTPKTYCPSEGSSSDYPSPGLVEQHYRISSAYDTEDTACSMTPSLSSECHSPHTDAMSEPEWSPASVLHPSLTTASMTNILSAEYDVFAHYDGSYPDEVYARRSRSPIASMRTCPQYPPIASPSSPGTPRMKQEDMTSEYGNCIESSHYPSPTLRPEPFPSGPTLHPSLPPFESPPHSSSGYHTEGMIASWPRPTEYAAEPDHFYSETSPIEPSFVLPMRRSLRATPERPQRAPRKLTTKEDANFQCNRKGCGKFFSRSYNYKAHMETHREKREYPFPCDEEECSKRFVRKTDLQRHVQSVHMKERNHKCDYCGRMFARRDTLKRHKSDGCHRRFDIGTLDLRADIPDQGELFSPPSLPPLAISPLESRSSVVPPLRQREEGESDPVWSG